jgi:tetratricopeptide (TPR) repeat protein
MGYSGWEGDVIMNALNNRLQSPLPFNLYWFSYNRSDCDKLPAWITGNPNVRFVVPGSRGMSVGADSQVSDIAAAEIPNVGERGGAGPTLPARKVLDLLVKSFTLDSPPLTKAPLQFFADQLGQSVFREEEDNSGIDIYSFQSVVARVQLAARLLAAKERAQSDVERTMEKVRDALRRSDYRGAIEAANSIPIADAEQRQLEELMAVTSTAADNLGDNSSDQIQAYGLIAAAAEHIARGDATNPHISISWAHALVRKTNVLLAMKQYEKVVAICDELAKRFRNAKEPEILEQVGRGLNNKGHSLSQLDRKEEAIRVYSQVVELFGNATEPRLCARAAAALFNTSTTLGELKRYQDAITVCDDVINRFGHSAEPDLVNMVIRAMNNKAWNLSQLSRYAEAISLCDEVIRHFGQRDEPEVRDAVNRALLSKGIAAKQLSKYDDGLSALDEVVKRLKGTTKPPMLEFIAKALLIKAQIFKTLGEKEQLLTVYSEMVQAFEGHSHEPLRPYLVLVKKMLKEHDQAVATQIDPS